MKNDFFPSPLQTLCPDRDSSLIPWVYGITFYPHNTFKKTKLGTSLYNVLNSYFK